ncbi:hypothetical protein O181_094341 [Austropuccinia psidii MF-1]|uniref:Uncharacterized protein n=1 Tax=Austropuccinia psidii MF-1 TaxID=1389203 RepID=A0A9Q3J3A2_9BASI|nr:hypothetical protein [Austropuccinia psidii MF-1]
MSSKITEITESSPSEPPPSVLCGSGVLSLLASPSMASSGDFDPSQTYDGYKAVEILDPACTEFLAKGKYCFEHYNPRSSKCHHCYLGKKPYHQAGRQVSNVRRYLWSKKDGPFGKELPVSDTPTPDATSWYFALTGSRKRDVARWTNVGRRIANSPPYPNAEGSDELYGEEVEVVPHSAGDPVNSSLSHPPAKAPQSHNIHNTPRNFQPTLSTIPTSIPPASPNPSHTRPASNQAVRPSTIPQPRNSPMVTSQQPQPMASTSRRREELSPLTFPASQVLKCRDQWPIRVTREDPNTASENQDAVARVFRRVDRNSRKVIMYANDRTIPGTASEGLAAKFAWYE